jgi:hypothetical protein
MAKPQISKTEGQALIQKWEQSGKSIVDFCKEESIPTHRVNYWKKKCRNEAGSISKNKFVSVDIQPSTNQVSYEIQTPTGYIIRVIEPSTLSELIMQLK